MSLIKIRTLVLLLIASCSIVYGASFDSQRVSKTQPGTSGCTDPPPTSSFLTTDAAIYLYFYASTTVSDHITSDWLAPNGDVLSGGDWNPISGRYCYTGASLTINANTPPTRLGNWQARVYNNGSLLFSAPFTLTAPSGGIQPRGPDYTGSFDGIDCSHIFGWAEDRGNPGGVVNVDIFLDGSLLATVPAGDYRQDLANQGIGNHAFNFYALPPNLKDGRLHTVRVVYSGTSVDLPNSPQQFQNACGGGGSNGGPSNPTVQWTTLPPETFRDGQSFTVAWTISGATGATYSHVHIAFDANAVKSTPSLIVRPDAGADGPQSQSVSPNAALTGPLSPGTTVYFVVHASDGASVNYYGDVVHGSVANAGNTPTGRNFWVYSALPTRTLRSQADAKLQDFLVVLEKSSASNGYQRYTISVLGDNLIEISSAELTIVRTPGVKLSPSSTQVFRNLDIPGLGLLSNLEGGSEAGWQDLTLAAPAIGASDSILGVIHDVVGFIPVVGDVAGDALSLRDLYGDVSDLWTKSDSVVPSASLRLMMQDVNNNHVDNLMATRLRASFDGHLVFGVRFAALIDDSSGQAPSFFVKAKNSKGTYVGVEIGSDPSQPVISRQ